MTIGGVDLPAGADVAPCIYLVHHREDVYPEPDAFRPERFLGVKPGTYTWLPFGGGVRRCIGASFALFEMQVVLGTVLRSVELRAVDAGVRAHGAPDDHARAGARRAGGSLTRRMTATEPAQPTSSRTSPRASRRSS